jgi:hypothetical protein
MQVDSKPHISSPRTTTSSEHTSHFDSHNFGYHVTTSSRTLDLDGMTVMTDLVPLDHQPTSTFDLNAVPEIQEERSLLDSPDSPNTAAFAPFMDEIFGSSYFCPSPIVLHIGDPPRAPSPKGTSNKTLCPIWKRSNELFGQVFSYRPSSKPPNLESTEAGLLYLGIKEGWDTFSEWTQSPAVTILKSVDEHLFSQLSRMERLAVAYKSFKLLRVSAHERYPPRTLESMNISDLRIVLSERIKNRTRKRPPMAASQCSASTHSPSNWCRFLCLAHTSKPADGPTYLHLQNFRSVAQLLAVRSLRMAV